MKPQKKLITSMMAMVFFAVCSLGYATVNLTDNTTTLKKKEPSATETKALKAAANQGTKKVKEFEKLVNRDIEEAFNNVKEAIEMLDKKDPDVSKVISQLQTATGKFEGAIAMNKDAGLVPVENNIEVNNLIATADEVNRDRAFISDLIKDGKIQEARELIAPLRSDISLKTVSLPLVTYTSAIKDATKELSNGKLEDAKETLVLAMNSLVIEDKIIPIPIIAAHDAIEKASKMDKNEKEAVRDQLKTAKKQVNLAEALGYLAKDSMVKKDLLKQIDEIEKEIKGKNKVEKMYDELLGKVEKIYE